MKIFEKLESKKLANYSSFFGGIVNGGIYTSLEYTLDPQGNNSKDAESQQDPDGFVMLSNQMMQAPHASFINLQQSQTVYTNVVIAYSGEVLSYEIL